MNKLYNPSEIGCTSESLGQFPPLSDELLSVQALISLFKTADERGYENAVDIYVAAGAQVSRTPEDQNILNT